MRSTAIRVSALLLALVTTVAATVWAQSDPAALFKEAAAREAALRRELSAAKSGAPAATQRRVRTLVGAFDDLARLYPAAGQGDKALWLGASLSADLFFQAGDDGDRDRALELLSGLQKAFPGGSYARQADLLARRLEGAPRAAHRPAPAAPSAPSVTPTAPLTVAKPQPAADATSGTVKLTAVRRDLLPEAVRITFELDREVTYHSERIPGPERVFVDMPHTRAVQPLRFAVLPYDDGVVRRVRVGSQPTGATRVVLDLDGAGRHSVYTLYNPYRIVVDVERPSTAATPAQSPVSSLAPPPRTQAPSVVPLPASTPPVVAHNEPPAAPLSLQAPPLPSEPSQAATAAAEIAASLPLDAPASAVPPVTPAVNTRGGFSLSRQLGLGIARIVIDAGHGGHDPGAKAKGLSESDLTLDVALRLEKLLLRQPGVEVIQTRRTNAFVPLEERTEIANRSGADIFLSIHANASADGRARGVETYYLNFAPNAEAEAVAARENAASTRSMRQLPELVRTIALNNKLDESRDLARLVQESLFAQVRKSDKRARNLGVKQAPFMVLVGAQMPSILTEISFLTNAQDAGLLATEKYRQQIAEALLAGVTRYQQALKKAPAVATQ
jgi:N-acetylmuramoyl-L-alanine amidase